MVEITQDIIQKLVNKSIGRDTITITPIEKGVMSKVFKITTENDAYIFRYNLATESRYEIEKWAIEQVANASIPVAKVLATGTKPIDNETKINYSVQELLAGDALSDSIPSEPKQLLESAGVLLKTMHSIKIKRFGHLTPSKEGVVRTWPEFLFYHFKSSNSDYLDTVQFLTSSEIDQISDVIINKLSNINIKDGRMLHMDFSLDHIFYSEAKITGFIDFENVGAGDPLYDIATFEFYNEVKYPDANFSIPLLKGYGLEMTPDTQALITYYKLAIGFWKIANRLKANRQETTERVRTLLKQYLYSLQ